MKQFFVSRCLCILALCALCGAAARAAPVYWLTPSGTNDWSVGTNWSGGAEPAAGEDVIITNANIGVLLTNSTAVLSSILLSNTCTLVFSNWGTSLSATNVTIMTNAVMTLPGPFTNTVMSNRVWIVCTNLFIASGGSINADFKGYAGAATNETQGHSPVGRGSTRAGGSYGGFGGLYSDNGWDLPYGSPDNPVLPGSGGGAYGTPPYRGGAGGGAILIQASNATVNGIITANGQTNPFIYGAAGSGGGILIACRTLAGTNGTIRANGGNSTAYGAGAGGRIAVLYDVAAQSLAPQPSILFSVARGTGGEQQGDIGTLYFPDARFLTSPISLFHGQLYFPGLTNLSHDNLTISNTWLRFPQNGFTLTVTNDLVITASAGRLEIGGNVLNTNVWEDTYNGVNARYRIFSEMSANPVINCGGNLILTNGGSLWIHAGLTNALLATGAEVNVSGDIRVWPDSAIYLFSHPTNGGSVFFRARNVSVATNAQITATGRGYARASRYPSTNTWGYGPGRGLERSGGGYGGRGGNYGATKGLSYGLSNAPVDSGSSGGRYASAGYYGGSGGGSVRIEAESNVTVDGTISADGGVLGGNGYSGGGSGGAISLRCRDFAGWTGGVVRANGGGQAQPPVTTLASASGGGGRIAIWRMYHTFSGTISYTSPTTNGYPTAPAVQFGGEDGTFFLGVIPPAGTIFTFH